MLITFSPEVVEDVALLLKLPTEFLKEFCKIALSNLQTGAVNQKAYARAAEQLQVDPSAVVRAISGLSELLIECAKRGISQKDFNASIAELKFNAEQIQVLSEFYVAHSKDIRSYLSELSLHLPHYRNLDWRLDVQLATRSLRHQVEPVFLFELETQDSGGAAHTQLLQSDFANVQNLVSQLEDAVKQAKSSHANRILRHIT